MRLVLVGPPGAGKGTQAQFIAEHLSVPKISTGDIFRANVSQGTPLGLEAKAFMDRGDLVPDDVTINMVRMRLAEPDAAGGFLLDGFPRTVPQATALDEMLQRRGKKIDHVLQMEVPDAELIHRLSGRQTCPRCQTTYGPDSPPKKAGICDKDGEKLIVRPDDEPERIQQRLKEYWAKTALLTGYYKARGVVRPIDAMGTVDEVEHRIVGALK